MLTADDVNAIEDWVYRLEAATRKMLDAAAQMETAANKSNEAAFNMGRYIREIPSHIRVGP